MKRPRQRTALILAIVLWSLLGPIYVRADDTLVTPAAAEPAGASKYDVPAADAELQTAASDSLSAMVRQAIIDNLHGDYQDNDDWGQTKEAFHGFKIRTHDWHVKIQKKTKPVKHGLWKKYQVGVVDPAHRLQVQIGTLQPVGPGRLAFQVALTADLHGEARFERWRQGIKLLNFSAEADTRVDVRMDCEVGFRLVRGKFLSDIVIEPQVNAIDIKLVDLDVQRVSKIEGLAAHEIGNALRGTIADQLAHRGPKIAAKINKSIAKRRDKLRFSPDQFVSSGWSQLQNKLGYQPAVADAVEETRTTLPPRSTPSNALESSSF